MNISSGGPVIDCEDSGIGAGAGGVVIDFNNFQGRYKLTDCGQMDFATAIKNLALAGNHVYAHTSFGNACGYSVLRCNNLTGDLTLWEIGGAGNSKKFLEASNSLQIFATNGSTQLFNLNNSGNLSVPGTLGFGGLAGGNGGTFAAPGGGFTAARTFTWPDASGTPALVLTGTSSSLGGSALTAGTCSSTTVSITGATTSMAVSVSPASDPGSGFYWLAFVSSSNTVTLRICAAVAGTPTATTYNVRVIQ